MRTRRRHSLRARRTAVRARRPGRPWQAAPRRSHRVAAEARHELHQPLALVGERAAPRREGDGAELGGEPFDPFRHVTVVGEAGVVEAVLEHGAIAGQNRLRIAPVGDDSEAVPTERKIALMRLHRRLDHPLRDPQEPLVEGRVEHERLLHQVDDLLQLSERVAPVAMLGERRLDLPPPLPLVGLDAGAADGLGVCAGRGDRDRAVGEPVPVGDLPRRYAGERDRDRLVVELRECPADRPREAELRAPAHRLPELQALDDRGKPLRQNLPELLAGDRHSEEAFAFLKGVGLDTMTFGEAGGGLLPQRDGRPLHPLVRRAPRQILDADNETARTDPHLRRRAAELLLDERGQLLQCLPAGTGRQLLAADLKEELRHRSRVRRSFRRRRARACARARCRRRARSRRSRRVRRAG